MSAGSDQETVAAVATRWGLSPLSPYFLEKLQMKAFKVALFATGFLTLGANAFAEDGLALAKKSGCLSCHAVDHKVIGPAYKDVAKKYKGEANAETKLVAKVKKGGSGVWGAMPMPAQSQLSDTDAHALVKWVLAQ